MKRNLLTLAISSFCLVGVTLFVLNEIGIFSQPVTIFNGIKKTNFPKVITKTQTLPDEGFLSQHDSIIILKVSDDYIHLLYPLLDEYLDPLTKKCLRPSPLRIGGHVTLFKKTGLTLNIKQKYHFNLKGAVEETVIKKFHKLTIHETWYEIAITSPELVTAFQGQINPDRLHISIAVSKYIEGTDLCYF
jgi:hypothetical protein